MPIKYFPGFGSWREPRRTSTSLTSWIPLQFSKMNGFQSSDAASLPNSQALEQPPRKDAEYPNVMIIFGLTRWPTSLKWLRDSKGATSMQGKGETGCDRCPPRGEAARHIWNLSSFRAVCETPPASRACQQLRLIYPGVFSQPRGRGCF